MRLAVGTFHFHGRSVCFALFLSSSVAPSSLNSYIRLFACFELAQMPLRFDPHRIRDADERGPIH